MVSMDSSQVKLSEISMVEFGFEVEGIWFMKYCVLVEDWIGKKMKYKCQKLYKCEKLQKKEMRWQILSNIIRIELISTHLFLILNN